MCTYTAAVMVWGLYQLETIAAHTKSSVLPRLVARLASHSFLKSAHHLPDTVMHSNLLLLLLQAIESGIYSARRNAKGEKDVTPAHSLPNTKLHSTHRLPLHTLKQLKAHPVDRGANPARPNPSQLELLPQFNTRDTDCQQDGRSTVILNSNDDNKDGKGRSVSLRSSIGGVSMTNICSMIRGVDQNENMEDDGLCLAARSPRIDIGSSGVCSCTLGVTGDVDRKGKAQLNWPCLSLARACASVLSFTSSSACLDVWTAAQTAAFVVVVARLYRLASFAKAQDEVGESSIAFTSKAALDPDGSLSVGMPQPACASLETKAGRERNTCDATSKERQWSLLPERRPDRRCSFASAGLRSLLRQAVRLAVDALEEDTPKQRYLTAIETSAVTVAAAAVTGLCPRLTEATVVEQSLPQGIDAFHVHFRSAQEVEVTHSQAGPPAGAIAPLGGLPTSDWASIALTHRSVNVQLAQSVSAAEIDRLVQRHAASLDAVGISTALHRLAKLHPSNDHSTMDSRVHGLVVLLLKRANTTEMFSSMPARNLANILYSLARLRHTDDIFLSLVIRRLPSSDGSTPATNGPTPPRPIAATASSKRSHPSNSQDNNRRGRAAIDTAQSVLAIPSQSDGNPLCQKSIEPVTSVSVSRSIESLEALSVEAFTPQELTNAVWALARLQVGSSCFCFLTSVCMYIASAPACVLANFTMQNLSILLWGICKLDYPRHHVQAEQVLQRLSEYLCSDSTALRSCALQNVANLLWSCAKVSSASHVALSTVLLRRALGDIQGPCLFEIERPETAAPALARILWAIRELGSIDDDLLRRLLEFAVAPKRTENALGRSIDRRSASSQGLILHMKSNEIVQVYMAVAALPGSSNVQLIDKFKALHRHGPLWGAVAHQLTQEQQKICREALRVAAMEDLDHSRRKLNVGRVT
eukprot:GHVT01101900.1.p1 GENE.GHVT01101900.1~~GHVT01101900.1.p1  ORF type:complete len:927 (+),score=118.41 GHVT01101900.1:1576-4356(+)